MRRWVGVRHDGRVPAADDDDVVDDDDDVSDSRFANGWRAPGVFGIENCEALDVFHVEPDGWVYDGSVDTSCTETSPAWG